MYSIDVSISNQRNNCNCNGYLEKCLQHLIDCLMPSIPDGYLIESFLTSKIIFFVFFCRKFKKSCHKRTNKSILDDSETIQIDDDKLSKQIAHWRCFNRHPFVLIRPDAKSSDIVQGLLGNCWFLSPLSLVVENSKLMNNILITNSMEFASNSWAHVRLFYNGKWCSIIVDDRLPCNHADKLIFSEVFFNKITFNLNNMKKNIYRLSKINYSCL